MKGKKEISWVSLAQFARSANISKAAVSKAVSSWLAPAIKGDGRDRKVNLDLGLSLRPGSDQVKAKSQPIGETGELGDLISLNEAKRIKEIQRARIARAKADREEGLSIPKAETVFFVKSAARIFTSRAMELPATIAGRCYGMSREDIEEEVERIIRKIVQEIGEELGEIEGCGE